MIKTTLFKAIDVADEIYIDNTLVKSMRGKISSNDDKTMILQMANDENISVEDQDVEIDESGQTVVNIVTHRHRNYRQNVFDVEKYSATMKLSMIQKRPITESDLIS